jgi:hypothetical protein
LKEGCGPKGIQVSSGVKYKDMAKIATDQEVTHEGWMIRAWINSRVSISLLPAQKANLNTTRVQNVLGKHRLEASGVHPDTIRNRGLLPVMGDASWYARVGWDEDEEKYVLSLAFSLNIAGFSSKTLSLKL